MRLQAEANLLKSLISGGSRTKILALGIGSGVDESELRDMASSPREVILVQDFTSLPLVEGVLRNESCRGNFCLFITMDNNHVSALALKRQRSVEHYGDITAHCTVGQVVR